VRVLVVEDETRMAEALARGLRAEGFTVDIAPDGLRGLRLARDADHDVVLLDLRLPGLSGYEVCRRLRASEVWTPVLVLSAKDGEFDQASTPARTTSWPSRSPTSSCSRSCAPWSVAAGPRGRASCAPAT